MWQLSGTNPTDVILQYWSTAGSVFDFHGVFTLASGEIATVAVTTATVTVGTIYYLAPDGNTTWDLVPAGLNTTH
jgi:hypothetical protein